MKLPTDKAIIIGILILGTLSFSFYSLVRSPSPRLFARWNLLLDGHVLCNLVERSEIQVLPEEYRDVNVMGRWFAYDHGKCIGYIDGFGDLIDKQSPARRFEKWWSRTLMLCWAVIISVSALFLWCAGNLVARIAVRRRLSGRVGPTS